MKIMLKVLFKNSISRINIHTVWFIKDASLEVRCLDPI